MASSLLSRVPRPLRLVLAGLVVGSALLAVASAAEAQTIHRDTFDTDPNLSGDWEMHRMWSTTTGVMLWDAAAEALSLVHSTPGSGGPWPGAAESLHPLTSTRWNMHFDAVGEGAYVDAGFLAQFHSDMGVYELGTIQHCGLGWEVMGSAPLAHDGYAFEVYDQWACGAMFLHSNWTAPWSPHHGILEGGTDKHHAAANATAVFDGLWRSYSICFDDGRVRAHLDGTLLFDAVIDGFDSTHMGWGFSTSTDGYNQIMVDNVLVEDTGSLTANQRCWARAPCGPVAPPVADCHERDGLFADHDFGGLGGEDEEDDGPVPCPRIGLDPPVTGWVMRTGQPITFRVVATEATPEEGFLLRLLDGHPHLPANATFDPTTGAFAWTPGAEAQGADAFLLTFQASRPPGQEACARTARIAMWPTGLAVDRDRDGVADPQDNCVSVPNRDQRDADRDEVGDACDETVAVATPSATASSRPRPTGDVDGDGVADVADGCPTVPDAQQADLDADGAGDACDLDADGDSVSDVGAFADNCPALANPGQEDRDGDDVGDACDEPAVAPTRAPAASTTAPGGPAAAAPLPAVVLVLAGVLVAAASRRAR